MNRRQRRHFERFHEVNIYYPGRVLQAYGGDFDRAMADNDEQVALRVAAWERQQGLFVRNWSGLEGPKPVEPGHRLAIGRDDLLNGQAEPARMRA